MYNLDEQIISYISRYNAVTEVQKQGVNETDLTDEYKAVWRFVLRSKREFGDVPSLDVIRSRFPDISLPTIRKRDLPQLLSSLKQRRKFQDFLGVLQEAATNTTDFDSVDDVIQTVQAKLNGLAMANTSKSHLVDLFSEAVRDEMIVELTTRHEGNNPGIPTGLTRLDNTIGGLHKQNMVVIVGRSGLGKSWLDLLAVAHAVIGGYKCMLYPLEMNLADTAFRLYTIFTHQLYGQERVLKNYDLSSGNISPKKVVRFLNALQDKFAGQLLVADVASLADPYTNERIEAEVESYKPDMFWVDYLTLLKPPPGAKSGDDWAAVRQLSQGIKTTAMRQNVVGGCSAQVNREAIRAKVFLPRLEHISYGDSIGQDADQVISINRRDEYLYWSLVKNRGGPEIGRTRLLFDADAGSFSEVPGGEDDDE